ncbi:MAG: hypothetical protein AB7N91_06680 [Candidatus Tectimicrobiota bacterium]
MQAQSLGRLPDLSLYADAQSPVSQIETTIPTVISHRLIAAGIGLLLFAGSLGAWVYLIGYRFYTLSHL